MENSIIASLNTFRGTAEHINKAVSDDIFAEIEAEQEYDKYINFIDELKPGLSKLEKFFVFYQLEFLFKNNKDDIKALDQWYDFVF